MPTACICTKDVRAPARRQSHSSFCWRGRCGANGSDITLSETVQELGLVAKRHGWLLDKVDVFELVPPETTLDPDRELTVLTPPRWSSPKPRKSSLIV